MARLIRYQWSRVAYSNIKTLARDLQCSHTYITYPFPSTLPCDLLRGPTSGKKRRTLMCNNIRPSSLHNKAARPSTCIWPRVFKEKDQHQQTQVTATYTGSETLQTSESPESCFMIFSSFSCGRIASHRIRAGTDVRHGSKLQPRTPRAPSLGMLRQGPPFPPEDHPEAMDAAPPLGRPVSS